MFGRVATLALLSTRYCLPFSETFTQVWQFGGLHSGVVIVRRKSILPVQKLSLPKSWALLGSHGLSCVTDETFTMSLSARVVDV